MKTLYEYLSNINKVFILDFDLVVPDYRAIKSDFIKRLASLNIQAIHILCPGNLPSCVSRDATNQPYGLQKSTSLCTRCISYSHSHDPLGSVILERSSHELSEEVLSKLLTYARFSFMFRYKRYPRNNRKDQLVIEQITDSLKTCYCAGLALSHHAKDSTFAGVNLNYAQHQAFQDGFGRTGISLDPSVYCASWRLVYRAHLGPILLGQHSFLSSVLKPPGNWLYKFKTNATYNAILRRVTHGDYNVYSNLSKPPLLPGQSRNYRKKVTYMLSSSEEVHAHLSTFGGSHLPANPFGFQSQSDCLAYIITLAGQHPDILFIVRLHPRMKDNVRLPGVSDEIDMITDMTSAGSPNVKLIDDTETSPYALVNSSDLVCVTWSTVGLESIILGKKTIAFFPEIVPYPIADLQHQPYNLHELNEHIISPSLHTAPINSQMKKLLNEYYLSDSIACNYLNPRVMYRSRLVYTLVKIARSTIKRISIPLKRKISRLA